MNKEINTTTGEHSGASPGSHKFCPNCGSKAFTSGDWWACGTSRTGGKLHVTELCRAREEINHLWDALHDMADTLAIPSQYDETVIAEEVKKLKAVNTDSKWHTIETAPKDGTELLLLDKCGAMATGAWDEIGAWMFPWGFLEIHATHWMPLPSFPNAKDHV